jgi:hypothetical protein
MVELPPPPAMSLIRLASFSTARVRASVPHRGLSAMAATSSTSELSKAKFDKVRERHVMTLDLTSRVAAIFFPPVDTRNLPTQRLEMAAKIGEFVVRCARTMAGHHNRGDLPWFNAQTDYSPARFAGLWMVSFGPLPQCLRWRWLVPLPSTVAESTRLQPSTADIGSQGLGRDRTSVTNDDGYLEGLVKAKDDDS